ncbi:MAG: N-(5'-phosphoribosyl)anthranilate isomerase [Acidobacteria bacterium]|nr:MAG: N-(5'-phosphoribosyl)anthranilate isomerase [Acidobacteriota bacterium]
MTLIKICGITNVKDALFCAEQGADFLGFIFVRDSPRYVEPEHAAEICGAAAASAVDLSRESGGRERPPLHCVGVFRNESRETVRRIVDEVGLDVVQLHGNETDDDIAAIGMPAIKAFRVGDALPAVQTKAEWVMFDSGGGTGRVFDWKLIDGYREKPFFLAGGITPDNVGEAIRIVKPDAIDVASGVESAPGVKDHDKVRKLFERVRA